MPLLLLLGGTLLRVICYNQLMERRNKLFTFKQEFGNCPEWPTKTDMFFMYILQSEKTGEYCVGTTGNLPDRLLAHNSGKSPYTKGRCPWKLIYNEPFATFGQSRQREHEIKSWKNPKDMIQKLGLNSIKG